MKIEKKAGGVLAKLTVRQVQAQLIGFGYSRHGAAAPKLPVVNEQPEPIRIVEERYRPLRKEKPGFCVQTANGQCSLPVLLTGLPLGPFRAVNNSGCLHLLSEEPGKRIQSRAYNTFIRKLEKTEGQISQQTEAVLACTCCFSLSGVFFFPTNIFCRSPGSSSEHKQDLLHRQYVRALRISKAAFLDL